MVLDLFCSIYIETIFLMNDTPSGMQTRDDTRHEPGWNAIFTTLKDLKHHESIFGIDWETHHQRRGSVILSITNIIFDLIE